jgi:hypothetical protein
VNLGGTLLSTTNRFQMGDLGREDLFHCSLAEDSYLSQFKVEVVRKQIFNGTYDLDRRLDIVIDRLVCENGLSL